MDTDISKKKMVSSEQVNSLLDFMKEHPNLAKGQNRGRRGKLMSSLKIWNSCAKKLNAQRGAVKDGKGWSKYWCDWKYRVRRHALELKAAKDSDKPAPDGLIPLTPMEETIMSIIGETALDGIVIKNDPLADEESHVDVLEDNEHDNEVPTSQRGTRAKKRKLERNSSRESYSEDDVAGPSQSYGNCFLPSIDFDDDAQAAKFLKLEMMKLENSKKMLKAVEKIATELNRLSEVLSRTVLVQRPENQNLMQN